MVVSLVFSLYHFQQSVIGQNQTSQTLSCTNSKSFPLQLKTLLKFRPKLVCNKPITSFPIMEDILLFHILPKLPVKSLFRFKCVCKKWLHWISHDPDFIREQSRCSLASPGIVYVCAYEGGLEFISMCGNSIDVPDPSLKSLQGFYLRILSSCNGLLCVSLHHQRKSTRTIYVGNPVTGDWSLIPKRKRFGFFALAFDPLDSLQTYKLVHPYQTGQFDDGTELNFAVFSSDTGLWTESGEKLFIKSHLGEFHGFVFKGGILYWGYFSCVIWFDPKKDRAGFLLPPDSSDGLEDQVEEVKLWVGLGVWEDKPSYSRVVNGKVIEAWTITEFKWTRIYTVSVDSVIQGIDNGLCSPLRIRDDLPMYYHFGKFLYFNNPIGGRSYAVICYNMKTGEVTESKAKGKESPSHLFEYNNSFVRVPRII